MKKLLINVLSSDGKISSKRVVTLLAFLMMCIGYISNLFWLFVIDPIAFDAMKWIVLGGLGFTASEQFSNKNAPKPEVTEAK